LSLTVLPAASNQSSGSAMATPPASSAGSERLEVADTHSLVVHELVWPWWTRLVRLPASS
jgi:hypothetical protein